MKEKENVKKRVCPPNLFLEISCCSCDESVEVQVELPSVESPAPDEPDTDW
jgi:hypothetical protein